MSIKALVDETSSDCSSQLMENDMTARLVLLAAGLVLTGCVTAAPAGEAAMCREKMAAMHKEGAPPAATSPEMMKECPMMKEMAAPAPTKEGHGDGPEHQH